MKCIVFFMTFLLLGCINMSQSKMQHLAAGLLRQGQRRVKLIIVIKKTVTSILTK